MPVPSNATLRAAVRWLEHRQDSSDTQLRSLFRTHPEFADITPMQYAAAYEWLRNSGLLEPQTAPTNPAHLVFQAAVREALWFSDADSLVPTQASMPEDGVDAATALNIEPEEAFALLRRCWGKVDTEERHRIGTAGELALVSLLESVEEFHVRHLAAESDGFGYDICALTPAGDLHIEVKSTTRRGRLSIHLSRNEFETMLIDSNWCLAAVRLDDNLAPVAVATVDREWVDTAAPVDRPGGRWEAVKLEVPPKAIIPGLPAVQETHGSLPSQLLGIPVWPGP